MRWLVPLVLIAFAAATAPSPDSIYDEMPPGVIPIYVKYQQTDVKMNSTVDWVGMSPSGATATIVSNNVVYSYHLLNGTFTTIDNNSPLASISGYDIKSDISGLIIYYGNGLYVSTYTEPLLTGSIAAVSTSSIGFVACNSSTVLSVTNLGSSGVSISYKPAVTTCKSLWVDRNHTLLVTVNGADDLIHFEKRTLGTTTWVLEKTVSGFGTGAYVSGSHDGSLILQITTAASSVVIDNNSTAATAAAVLSTVSDVASGPELVESVYPFQVLAYTNQTGMFVHALNTTGDYWYSTWPNPGYSPSSVEFSWDADTAVACTGSSNDFQVFSGCIADITFKKYNIPHNGYDSRINATLHECIDLCCGDEQCRVFQWIPAGEVREGYPDENCLLFLEDEKHFTSDYLQPYHTYIMRKPTPAPYVQPYSKSDDEGMSITPLLVAIVILLVGCIIFFFFLSRTGGKKGAGGGGGGRSNPTKSYKDTGKNNNKSEIDKSLLANEIGQDVEMEEEPAEEKKPQKEKAKKQPKTPEQDAPTSKPETPKAPEADVSEGKPDAPEGKTDGE
eukprot:TRINITY_DN472_c1_g1_i1.p1 TRINITY_DN472_c1_g1~~TRINITY_DN472_c1_g1_i1.p1  ORF type:complete len:574 (+),score=98.22 TRINITY_DN472_c1_g1_i1:46-1722(+)